MSVRYGEACDGGKGDQIPYLSHLSWVDVETEEKGVSTYCENHVELDSLNKDALLQLPMDESE